jgi:hypothetical protein
MFLCVQKRKKKRKLTAFSIKKTNKQAKKKRKKEGVDDF